MPQLCSAGIVSRGELQIGCRRHFTLIERDDLYGCPTHSRASNEWVILSRCLFAFEQFLLPLDAPAIARDVSIAAHHAMAWHRDRNRIGRTGASNRAYGSRLADLARDFGVAARLAARNLLQCIPHLLLKRGGANVERQ